MNSYRASVKSMPTSAGSPAGDSLPVWVSESEESLRALSLSLLLPSSSSSLAPSLSPSLCLLHHFSSGVRTQPSIGKLKPTHPPSPTTTTTTTPSPPSPPLLLRAKQRTAKPRYWHLTLGNEMAARTSVRTTRPLAALPPFSLLHTSPCLFASRSSSTPLRGWLRHRATLVRMKQSLAPALPRNMLLLFFFFVRAGFYPSHGNRGDYKELIMATFPACLNAEMDRMSVDGYSARICPFFSPSCPTLKNCAN